MKYGFWLVGLFLCAAPYGCTDDSSQSCGQCIRAVTCRQGGCGGPVVQSGCCPCPSGSIDDIACNDAGPTPDTPATPDTPPATDTPSPVDAGPSVDVTPSMDVRPAQDATPAPDVATDVTPPQDTGAPAQDAASDVPVSRDGARPRCTIMECFRPVTCCAGGCGGAAVATSCCACLDGEVDAIMCGGRCGG